jgi:threonine dehydrogenase-like Zn-dependent dehydrogenase
MTTMITTEARAGVKQTADTMKAIAVVPGRAGSVHLTTIRRPSVDDVANGRGVLVEVLRVGVDGTDKEINAAEYGAAPVGESVLVLGHESLGRVVAVGPRVTELAPEDTVVALVRRPGHSLYDVIGTQDMTTDDVYYERGINLLHGYLTEYYVDAADYIVRVPESLGEAAVLLEPTTVVQKGLTQAWEIQRRLKVWRPERAAVIGAGTIGLLATLSLRLRGLDVTTFALKRKPNLNADLVEVLGAKYVAVEEASTLDTAQQDGRFDIIFEASGYAPAAFEAMQTLAKNGILVLSSVTGGDHHIDVRADQINLDFVLGNKVMVGTVNANREHFESGVRDLALAAAQFPGWLERLLTDRVIGLENFAQLFGKLEQPAGAIKVFCQVSES